MPLLLSVVMVVIISVYVASYNGIVDTKHGYIWSLKTAHAHCLPEKDPILRASETGEDVSCLTDS